MKKVSILCLVLLLSISFNAFGQMKIKGNKEVTTEIRSITEFSKIEVIDNIDIFLVYNEDQSVTVETDSNLHQAIETLVTDGTLTIKTNAKIIRKKELKIQIKVNSKLTTIYAYNRAKITSNNSLQIDSLTINAFDNSDIDLKLNSKSIRVSGKKSSDLKLQVLCEEMMIWTEEGSSLKSTVDCDFMNVNCLDRSSITMEGTCERFEIEALGSSTFKGKSFVAEDVLVNATHSSDVYVNATNTIDIMAKNSSEVYIYSNPQITLTEFFDKASIYKKE